MEIPTKWLIAKRAAMAAARITLLIWEDGCS